MMTAQGAVDTEVLRTEAHSSPTCVISEKEIHLGPIQIRGRVKRTLLLSPGWALETETETDQREGAMALSAKAA